MKILSLDCYWQSPAATEQNAFEKVRVFHDASSVDLIYLAFPWATLFDLHDRNQGSVYRELKDVLQQLTSQIPQFSQVITVCQHIRLERHKSFLIDAGVTDVFWSHHANDSIITGLTTHPFPLYPVTQAVAKKTELRQYLATFIGAKANQYYLSKTRDFLATVFQDIPNIYIELKEHWHFNKTVYSTQIAAECFEPKAVKKDEKYEAILEDSVFAFCPSGTGPNSIRLWEAIHAGVIPVILADSYIPPGNIDLWSEACIILNESEIGKLPELLLEHNSQPALIEAKIMATKQLKFLYGVDTFISDIIDFEQKNKCKSTLEWPISKIACQALMNDENARSIIEFHQKTSSLIGYETENSDYLNLVVSKTAKAQKA